MIEPAPSDLAALLLPFYDKLAHGLAIFIKQFDQFAVPATGIYLGMTEWPHWRRHLKLFVALCAAPACLMAYAIYYMTVADSSGAIEKPHFVPYRAFQLLLDYFFVVPGALAALEIRRRMFPALVEQEDRERADPLLAERRRSIIIRHGFIAGLGLTTISFAIFCGVNLDPHPKLIAFNQLIDQYPLEGQASLQIGAMLTAVLLEELMWRAMFQTLLIWVLKDRIGLRAATWTAITVCAVLWTLTHPYSLAFAWAKYAQIIGLGFVLGWLMERSGVFACFAAHAVHNAALFFYGAVLEGGFFGVFGWEKPETVPWFIVAEEAAKAAGAK
jgi:membrane protease YdiL (CAAX protease family)